MTREWLSFGLLRPCLVDHFEDVAIDRFAEEESFERGWTNWVEQNCFGRRQPLLERREGSQRDEHSDMPPELILEGRHLKSLDEEDVHLLAATDVEPHQFDRRIAWHRQARVAQR